MGCNLPSRSISLYRLYVDDLTFDPGIYEENSLQIGCDDVLILYLNLVVGFNPRKGTESKVSRISV